MLYANGCSHTAGTRVALDSRFELAWPHVLGDMLGEEVYNDGKRGSSNDSIVNRTVDYISSCAIPPEFVVIQFTNPARFNLCDEHEHLMFPEGIRTNKRVLRYKKSSDLPNPEWVSYEKKMFRQMYFLQLFLEEHGVDKYVMTRWYPLADKQLNYGIVRHIDFSKHLFSTNIPGLYEQLHHNGYRYHKEDEHFDENGHRKIAECFYNHFGGNTTIDLIKDVYDHKEYDRVYRYED